MARVDRCIGVTKTFPLRHDAIRLRVLVSFRSLVGNGSGGPVRILYTDMAVLEAGEPRKDLPCAVISTKPILGFDLRYHSGYEVSVPLKELAGSEGVLTMLFRVTPTRPARR